MNINSGLDKARLVSNILMVILLAGNIFFSVYYVYNNRTIADQNLQIEQKTQERIQTARFMKFFIDTVLNTKGAISYDDRVKLENDVRQLHDLDVTKQWDAFVGSKDSKTAQDNVVKLMSVLSSKMI